jgi:hypothetical protein
VVGLLRTHGRRAVEFEVGRGCGCAGGKAAVVVGWCVTEGRCQHRVHSPIGASWPFEG